MSDLKEFLQEEAEHAEQNKDAVPGTSTRIRRPNRDRSKVLSVRLSPREMDLLIAQAELAGVGPSTLARALILQGLGSGGEKARVDLDLIHYPGGSPIVLLEELRDRLAKIEAQVAVPERYSS